MKVAKKILKNVYYKIPFLYELKNGLAYFLGVNNSHRDISDKAFLVFELIKKTNQPIFPMFGTLLALHRDGQVTRADDMDFAVIGSQSLSKQLVEFLEQQGAKLVGISAVDNGNTLAELSFEYVGVKVDIFALFSDKDGIKHVCPNFRKSKPSCEEVNGLQYMRFDSHFEVTYPDFNLKENESGLLLPDDPTQIFDLHYGKDWMVPKEKNFIDFAAYRFIKNPSFSVYGSSKDLNTMLNDVYFSE